MVKAVYVYIGLAVCSCIVSNIWIMIRNNSFESEIIERYEIMTKSLRTEFSGQKKLMTELHRDEIELQKKEFDKEIREKKNEFHNELSKAHGDITTVRNAIYGINQKSEEYSEQVSKLQKENEATRNHYNQIGDVAQNHINELEKKLIECQHETASKQQELHESF